MSLFQTGFFNQSSRYLHDSFRTKKTSMLRIFLLIKRHNISISNELLRRVVCVNNSIVYKIEQQILRCRKRQLGRWQTQLYLLICRLQPPPVYRTASSDATLQPLSGSLQTQLLFSCASSILTICSKYFFIYDCRKSI